MAYKLLSADEIMETLGSLRARIDERFPESGLSNVCGEVSELASSELVEQFSCHFSGTSNPPIRSGTYSVRSRFLGRFQLYLAATGDDANESFARADFALLR